MTSSLVGSPLRPLADETEVRKPRRLPLLDQYLREQRELSAVERFAQRHADASSPLQERFYKDLLPATPPTEGKQYAFRVDLDICTGCKACVTACHNLNGLDEGETWRAVGLLHGGSAAAPVMQTVTTACHHCLDPACMNGCPVGAYEKDPVTGIVKHLDDQCIGCQYCTFTCPYEVPQYNAKRGIVRKCDMCSDRLAVGEAPACVQACPNEAISIALVDKQQALEDAQGGSFLPGAPSPGITIPTTVYQTTRVLPRNMLPADFYAVKPSHHHTPLVIMLVLTQLSVGAFVVDAVASRFLLENAITVLRPLHALVALSIGLAALGASVFHLGRPLYAFRAIIGLRTSWMSREILAFGAFAGLAVLYSASLWHTRLFHLARAPSHEAVLQGMVALTGLAGVLCSVLIYHVTRRAFWSAPLTAFKFFMTATVLGLATTLVTFSVGAAVLHDADTWHSVTLLVRALSRTLITATLIKFIGELITLRHARDMQYNELKRSALLMKGDLAKYTLGRFATLIIGGALVPLWHLSEPVSAWVAAVSLVFLLVGELLERTLFFAASTPSKMPGGLA